MSNKIPSNFALRAGNPIQSAEQTSEQWIPKMSAVLETSSRDCRSLINHQYFAILVVEYTPGNALF